MTFCNDVMNGVDFTTGVEAIGAALRACLPCLLLAAGILMTGLLLNIAPAIRRGLFYAMLGAGAGSAFALTDGRGNTPPPVRRKKFPGFIMPEALWQSALMEQIPDQAREWAEPEIRKPRKGPAGAGKTVFPTEDCFALAAIT